MIMPIDWSGLFGRLFPRPRPPKPDPPHPDPGPSSFPEDEVIVRVNSERALRGIPLLLRDEKLMDLAGDWVATMARTYDFKHGDFTARFRSVYPGPRGGEVIACGPSTPAEVVAEWMNSTGHMEIILDPTYRTAGVGVAGDYPMYWCMDLAGLIMAGRAEIKTGRKR
jgi:uncharacterized protein YkwD